MNIEKFKPEEEKVPDYDLDTLIKEVRHLREMENTDPNVALDSIVRKHFPTDLKKQKTVRGEISERLLEMLLGKMKASRQSKIDERHNRALKGMGG